MVVSDADLMRRVKEGDREALGEIAARHYDAVWRYMRAKTGDRELAYDLTQEVFERVCAGTSVYTERAAFTHYLMKIAHNVCVDCYRAAQAPLLPEEASGELEAEGDAFAECDERDAVNRALAKLPEEQREAVILRYINGMKVKEIAEIQGTPLATAKSRIKAARDRMKAYLKEEGIE